MFRGTVTLDIGHFGWGTKGPPLTLVGASVTPGTNGKVGLVDGADAGNELCLAGKLDRAKVAGKVVLCRVDGSSPVAKSAAVQAAGGVGVIVYNDPPDEDLYTDNAFIPMVMLDRCGRQAAEDVPAGCRSRRSP